MFFRHLKSFNYNVCHKKNDKQAYSEANAFLFFSSFCESSDYSLDLRVKSLAWEALI